MQAYQSAPCPYCGATWNPPGAQVCANCRNALPAPPPGYAPPGYAPQGQEQQPYPPMPQYPGAPTGYPGQPGQPGPPYPTYAPPGYGQPPGYPQQPGAYGQPPGYPSYAPAAAAVSGSTTLRLFGQTFSVPLALPPIVVRYQQQLAYAIVGLVGLIVLLLGVTPALASSQIAGADQAVASAVIHQSKVDAGFATFFAPDSSTTDLASVKAQALKDLQSIDSALAIVQADESTLRGADQRLVVLQFVAPASGDAIAAERQRLKTALDGLKQADEALTAGSNQGKVMVPALDAMIDFSKMYAAIGKHDLAGAGAPYPDAQQKLQLAMSLDHAPGVPDALAKQVSAFNDLVNNTESLVQAIANKDAAATKSYSAAVQAGLKTLTALVAALPADYEVKTYAHLQKGYDAA
ncbi:MAG: hypothetical protein E6I16_14205, partial [Chloroflexi bacterium]